MSRTQRETDVIESPRRVGVVGAGVIGSGVAQALAQTEHEVIVVDVASDALAHAEAGIRRDVRFHHLVAGTNQQLDVDRVLERMTFTRDYEHLASAEFVIENVTESWAVKRSVYARLAKTCSVDTPLAANTSAIPISKIASVTPGSERVLGMHFMNPVPLKPAVEVIRGRDTSDRALSLGLALLRNMGKDAIVVGDSPGFVSNRVLMLAVNEAAFLVQEGVASAESVDDVFKRCFGHPMGPLETADLIGLDTVLRSIEVLHEELADQKYRPCPLLRSLVEAGALGRKSGSGFHEYGPRRLANGDRAVDE